MPEPSRPLEFPESAERRVTELERRVDALRSMQEVLRLRPHFLLNALNVVAVLLEKGEAATAKTAVVRLGSLLQHVLRADAEGRVPLLEEVAFVRDYLRVQSLRSGRSPRLVVDADPAVLDAQVPPMLLQPLVENSLRHGLPTGHRTLEIRIRARRAVGRLWIEVEDDGRGFPPDWRWPEDAGTGLRGVRARVRQADDGAPGARPSLEPRNAPSGGARVSLTLPAPDTLPAPETGAAEASAGRRASTPDRS